MPLARYAQFGRDKIRSKDVTMSKIGGFSFLVDLVVTLSIIKLKYWVQDTVLYILGRSTDSKSAYRRCGVVSPE